MVSTFAVDGMTLTNSHAQPGDVVQIEGVFKRRTLWQWLTRRPTQLAHFIVGKTEHGLTYYTPFA
jgi:hypothetical protein